VEMDGRRVARVKIQLIRPPEPHAPAELPPSRASDLPAKTNPEAKTR